MTVPHAVVEWLTGCRFTACERAEHQWFFRFEPGLTLVVSVESLWRVIRDGRLELASPDDGHQFGLPAPRDLAAEMSRIAARRPLVAVVGLDAATGDLHLHLESGERIEVLSTSSGYEAWQVYGSHGHLAVCQGGGRIVVWDPHPPRPSSLAPPPPAT